MAHNWKYEDECHRYCFNCKIKEYWNDDEQKWMWLSTEEFMDCDFICQDPYVDKTKLKKIKFFFNFKIETLNIGD